MRKMVVPKLPLPFPQHAVVITGFVCLVFLVGGSQAQASNRTVDPNEAMLLNAMFSRLGLKADESWNITGEVCSGSATDTSDMRDLNSPAIKCDCSIQNSSFCHITQLKLLELNIVGPVPEELKELKYLWDLNLLRNHLTGPLPAFIGNLIEMKNLSVGFNSLSGPIPKELGNLQKLITLGMDQNNFTGSLPPELGNMTSLEEWYMDSSGLSGEIPNSYSKLKNMRIFRAGDNNFIGEIPDFIGSWTNLTLLWFMGNSFHGPIPSSFSSLTKLEDLRIVNMLNGSSSLDFMRELKCLRVLILRYSKISHPIPLYLGELTRLKLLDMSFNNLIGELPQALFNHSSLQFLFLGNNSLSGVLPAEKSTSLQIIDLSYNELSGHFPTWVTEENLKLNLVANKFVNVSSDSVLPLELSCLQRDVPCNRDSPTYDSFGINCGGRSITSSDGTLYEDDDQNLTTASYYVTETWKWGVSNVGFFQDSPSITRNEAKQITNTSDSELLQSARLSPSSLRYYGLGLQRGNYSVKLQFAEMAYPDDQTWKSTGRRVFDIYIQGILKEKDFDIRKEAGGTSFRAVTKEYTAPITNSFLEIHLFWAGKGTFRAPIDSYYGPSISAISVSPKDFTPVLAKKETGLIVGVTLGVAFLLVLVLGIFIWIKWRKRSSQDDDEELLDISLRAVTFSYSELRTATEDFNPANKLGEGGFGPVFKGKLSDSRVVAVKQLSVTSNQGKSQFVTEIATISTVQHRNLVKLHGCCSERNERLLVYEYLENGSLDQALLGKNKLTLDWPTRFKICLGTARGLAYLHEESSVRIVHRDVKASNILLDSDLNPKISDFGLARLYDEKNTHISTRVAGTIGYLAPEYAMKGHLTEKADVFGFGVLALEILCGRSNTDPNFPPEQIYLLEWAWHLHENKQDLEMVDPTFSSYNKEEVLRLIGVSFLCTQESSTSRPAMSRVVAMLAGDIEVGDVSSRPGYLTDWLTDDQKMSFMIGDGFSLTSGSSQPNVSLNDKSLASQGGSYPYSPSNPLLH